MNVSTSKTVLFACTFLSGVLAKIYDDIVDNYRFHKFSSPLLLEVLKGTFMLTFTVTSIFNPLYFIMMWFGNFGVMFLQPSSYEFTYEKSLYITSALLFAFINYDKLFEHINELYSSLFEIIIASVLVFFGIVGETILQKLISLPQVPQFIKDHCNIEKDVSLYKLAETINALTVCLITPYFLKNTTSNVIIVWGIGYLIIRLWVQIYSLFLYKPNSFPLEETQDKQPISKESVIKEESTEEPEEPKEEPEEPKEESEEEDPENKPETI